MSNAGQTDITRLLKAWTGGDKQALDALIPLVYSELHKLAHAYLNREGGNRAIQTTELVNEGYLQLARQTRVIWQDRAHFYGVSAQILRRILVEQARTRKAAKRGGGVQPISLDASSILEPQAEVDAADLDEALDRLTALDARQGQLVELRFFGGLSIEETAAVMDISPATVKRSWSSARAWLRKELAGT